MSGLNKTLTIDTVLEATAKPPREDDFVWDGKDEEDRPLSKQEMRRGIIPLATKNTPFRPRIFSPIAAL